MPSGHRAIEAGKDYQGDCKMSQGEGSVQNTRSSPRAVAPLEVDVEVEGERRKVLLVSRDIGAGGLFLRTNEPVPLWKKVKLEIRLPQGGTFAIGGEVVRSVSPEAGKQKNHPPGMAVAFDEVSRAKRKELVALVLDLCSQRPSKAERNEEKATPAPPAPAPGDDDRPVVVVRPPAEEPEPVIGSQDDPDEHFGSRTDDLLGQLDDLLDEVEGEVEDDASGASARPAAPAPAASEPEASPKHEPAPVEDRATEAEPEPPAPQAQDAAVARLRAIIAKYKQTLAGDTYYDVLRIGRKASQKQIETAYRKLMGYMKPPGPPDSLPEDLLRDLSSVLGKIRKAFAILGKPDRKRAYDFLIDNADEDIL